jgi:DNA modification methylase
MSNSLDAIIILGDCQEVLKGFEENTFDSMVTDPPGGIAFMGAAWDRHTMDGFEKMLTDVFLEAYRVLKPGAHILVWSIPRTSHRTAMAIERAGFRIRDALDNVKDRSPDVQAFLESLTEEQIELLVRAGPADAFVLHFFGQGFPKSMNVGKAIDKLKGAKRTKSLGVKPGHEGFSGRKTKGHVTRDNGALDGFDRPWMHDEDTSEQYPQKTAPVTPEAAQWEGFGTALKPAIEVWWLARKPLQENTVAKQILATGTGALNIDGCRVAGDMSELINPGTGKPRSGLGSHYNDAGGFGGHAANPPNLAGRWSANVVLTHSPSCQQVGEFNWKCTPGCPVKILDGQSGNRPGMSGGGTHKKDYKGGLFGGIDCTTTARNDSGGASRFFNQFKPDLEAPPFLYTGKITSSERKEDLEEEELVNEHPTVKTKKLMRWLVRLVTPPKGRVLDPFCGSGSTIVAAFEEGMSGTGIEREPEYHTLATKRVELALMRIRAQREKDEAFDSMFELESE